MKRRTILFFFIACVIQCFAQTYESEIEAARAGDANAQNLIGSFYETGTGGVEQQSDSIAFFWYQKASDKGNLNARERLADFYLNGKGVEQNSRKAFELYQRLAELGRAGSMDKLANRYELGDGVAKDIYQARDWYIKAMESGSNNAKRHLDALYKRYPHIKPNPNPMSNPKPEPLPATPLLKVNRYELAATREFEKTLQKAYPFVLKVYVENEGEGNADNVTVDIKLPQGVLMVRGKNTQSFTSIKGKETIDISYTIMVLDDFPTISIPIDIEIKENTGKHSKDWHTDISIGQRLPYPDISDIDIDIPITSDTQPNTYALIVSVENYDNIESVPFANSDSKLFREYCVKTLGVPEDNIIFHNDITKTQLDVYLDQLKGYVSRNNHIDKTKVIFYYAGHGIPDEEKRTAHLLLRDGFGNNSKSGVNLGQFYQQLSEIGSQSVYVFLDACFSGHKRDGGMIEAARGVAIKQKKEKPTNKMVIFTAAQSDESAYSYQDKQHGLFTYYLLKKFKETQGNISLGELSKYINDEVVKTSIRLNNGKVQTPTTDSSIVGWEKTKLK